MKSEAKEILGKELKCLDKGFIRLIDVMGEDSSIVQAARVSYGKGTKSVREDRGLIRYLMRHRHTSPFEMVEFKFHVKLPMFVARQWIRHRTANVNEYSGRYSVMKEEFYVPEIDQIRHQSQSNMQGRSEESLPEEESAAIREKMEKTQGELYDEYNSLLEADLTRELARINLPLSTYTEWYWKIDLHNLLHFLSLRMDEHAQYEIRVYANKIAEILKLAVPLTWEAFEDYRLKSTFFSHGELQYLKDFFDKLDYNENKLKEFGISGIEAREFKSKIEFIKNL